MTGLVHVFNKNKRNHGVKPHQYTLKFKINISEIHPAYKPVHSLPTNKILDFSKVKAVVDSVNVTEILILIW